MNNLGDAFDYIVTDWKMDLDEFVKLFILSNGNRKKL